MAREGSLDLAIRKRALARRCYHRKTHGNEFQMGMLDHLIGYKGRLVLLEAKAGTSLSPQQRREIRLAQAAGNIAEVCYEASLVDRICDCIDEGREWKNGEY